MKQVEALQLLKMGKNVFLTGAAGAGKTYLLNQYIRYLKENQVGVAITASTGIAATHLQGTTVHSWSGIGVKEQLTQQDLENVLTNERIKRNYKNTKVLIIDEISMFHKHQLDMIDDIARHQLNSEKAFGGLQVVLCGDFFQLPPVSTASKKSVQFAFEADIWGNADFHICYLQEQHRQKNDLLLTILNDIRNGTAGEHTKVPLRTRYKKEPIGTTKATKLFSRNINVERINDDALNHLPGKAKIFKMETDGFYKLVESLKRNCLAQEILKLKIGAEVMFIKNDMSGRYVNGTRCTVIDFDRNEGWPIVKTFDNEIITASPDEWKYEEKGSVRAVILQVPLRLAWAITIHKSQGMTLDAAEIDLGDAFEPGMGYVALSRVRSLSGLKLMNLNDMALRVHPDILRQDKIFKSASQSAVALLSNLSPEEIISIQKNILTERFEAGKIKKTQRKKNKTPTHLVTLSLLKEHNAIEVIAEKRELAFGTIITHVEKLNELVLLDDELLDQIKKNISKNDFDIIFETFSAVDDIQFLSPIYEALHGKYPYNLIRLVRLFL